MLRICALTPVYTPTAHKPFDAERIASQELRRDPLYPSLTPTQRAFHIAAAMTLGREQAAKYAGREPEELAAKMGAFVKELEGENLVAGKIVYAEYDAGTRAITLYQRGIAQMAAKLREIYSDADALALARNLLLAHELFHHLEATQIPSQLPRTGNGKSMQYRGSRNVRYSEMAAHTFALALLQLA